MNNIQRPNQRFPQALHHIFNEKKENQLHIKPFCHQISYGITHIGTALHQSANAQLWRGKMIIGLAKGIVFTGYILNTIIAVIESIVPFAFAGLALSLHAITRGRSIRFQKITLKLCAYYTNIVLIVALQALSISTGIYSGHHTVNALANHGVHGAAAIIAQFVGYKFDRWAGRNPVNNQNLPPSVMRAIHIIVELAPHALRDTARAAARDFAVHIRNNQNNQDLQAFIRNNPHYAEILNRFDFNRLRMNAQYRLDLILLFWNFLNQAGVLNHLLRDDDYGLRGLGMNQINLIALHINEHDKKYRHQLQALIKKSFLEIYDNEKLACMLSKEKNKETALLDGRENLSNYLVPQYVAHYVQLQEIKNDPICPIAFGAKKLHQYNNRNQLIADAKKHYNQLDVHEKEILTEMLLRTADFDLDHQQFPEDRKKLIQKLFNDIGSLAHQLHHGDLLAEKFINIDEYNQGNFNEAFEANNLFQRACKEAVHAINAREAKKGS